MSQFRNMVFEGDGVKGIAYAGAIDVLDARGLSCIKAWKDTSSSTAEAATPAGTETAPSSGQRFFRPQQVAGPTATAEAATPAGTGVVPAQGNDYSARNKLRALRLLPKQPRP
ncbi:MAG: hypothetical protein ACLFV7_12915, partial [Phycisphaerae bacterium]